MINHEVRPRPGRGWNQQRLMAQFSRLVGDIQTQCIAAEESRGGHSDEVIKIRLGEIQDAGQSSSDRDMVSSAQVARFAVPLRRGAENFKDGGFLAKGRVKRSVLLLSVPSSPGTVAAYRFKKSMIWVVNAVNDTLKCPWSKSPDGLRRVQLHVDPFNELLQIRLY